MIPKKRKIDPKTKRLTKQTYYPRYPLRRNKNQLALNYSNQISKAVKEHIKKPAIFKSNAIKAIALHNMDHVLATRLQQKRFHRLCDVKWCKYLIAVSKGEKYKLDKNKPLACHKQVQVEVEKTFAKCADLAKMERLTRNVSTNLNESIHARFF